MRPGPSSIETATWEGELTPRPLHIRSVKGVSLSTATNWAFNFIVGEATPILQEAIRWRLYPMHAGFCLISFVMVFFLYPETMGVPLEEMGESWFSRLYPLAFSQEQN